MRLNIKKILLLFVLFIPFIAQQFNAQKLPSFLLTGTFLAFYFMAFIAILIKNDKHRIIFFLKSPIFLLGLLFVVSQFITLQTAENKIELLNMAFMAFFLKTALLFFAFMFNFRLNDFFKYKKIINFVLIFIIMGLFLENIDIVNRFIMGAYYPGGSARFGFIPFHSFFPLSNSLAPYLLFYFLIYMFVFNNKIKTGVIYLILLSAANRTSILIFSTIFFKAKFTIKKTIFFVVLIFIAMNFYADKIESAFKEASFSDQSKIDMVPRLHYTIKSWEVFQDYKYFGIGLRRFSTESYWIKDNYFWQKKYNIHTEFIDEVGYLMDFSVTDTGLVFLAEIGIIGTIIIILLFIYLYYLGYKVKNKLLGIYLISGIVYLYNITDPFNTYVFGISFWFMSGVFFNEYYLLKEKK